MTTRNIELRSVLNPDKVAYRLSSDWDYNGRGNAPLSLHIQVFETYGDNLTQHSGAWTAQFSELTDVCLSLTAAIVADPLNDTWRQLDYVMRDTGSEVLQFVLSIKYREDKPQWYSIADRKLSSSESKRHDRRWEKVEHWMDGSPATALSIYLNHSPNIDWLQKLCIADDLRALANYPMWEDYFKPVTELKGDWHQAFQGLRAAAHAVQSLDRAKALYESAMHNTKPAVESVAA